MASVLCFGHFGLWFVYTETKIRIKALLSLFQLKCNFISGVFFVKL